MWPKKKPSQKSEDERKEMAVVERRLSRVESRLDLLEARESVLSRDDQAEEQ